MATKKPVATPINQPADSRIARGRSRAEAIFPVAPTGAHLPADYAATLQEIKAQLKQARVRAVPCLRLTRS